MIKDDVKLLCEAEGNLQWWAMVLFAEIADLVHHVPERDWDKAHTSVLYMKVESFPRLVVQHSLEEAKKKFEGEEKPPT